MNIKLQERDVRTLKLGAICALAIVLAWGGMSWYEHWSGVRSRLDNAREQVSSLRPASAKSKSLAARVPVFEMPVSEDEQKFLFRDAFIEQLKKAGIGGEPPVFLPVSRTRVAGYKVVKIKCKGRTKFDKALEFLGDIKSNPYLLGIEKFSFTCDDKKRNEVEVDIVVSSLAK